MNWNDKVKIQDQDEQIRCKRRLNAAMAEMKLNADIGFYAAINLIKPFIIYHELLCCNP